MSVTKLSTETCTLFLCRNFYLFCKTLYHRLVWQLSQFSAKVMTKYVKNHRGNWWNQLLAQSLRYQMILETNNWNLINLFSGVSLVYRSKVNSAVQNLRCLVLAQMSDMLVFHWFAILMELVLGMFWFLGVTNGGFCSFLQPPCTLKMI